MEFLKSAVTAAIAKGSSLPFSFGDRVDIDESVFTLHNGTRREDGSNCSIFSFEIASAKSQLPLARNALRKFRTLRHPGVIRILDTIENETHIYVLTERIVPLGWHIRRKSLGPEILKWGLYCAAKTVKFINDEAASVHGNIRVASIFTSESGEWKLGGFEVLSSMNETDAVIYKYGSMLPDSHRYSSPEVASTGWEVIRKNPIHAVDSYDFGVLITEIFTGSFSGPSQVGQTKNIPPSMHQSYKRLVNANPKSRLSLGHFLEQGRRSGGFFETHLIRVTEAIDNLGVKSEPERDEFLEELYAMSDDDVPEELFKMKILPELLKSVEFAGGGPKAFRVIMRLSKTLSEEEFESKVTPVVVRLFASPDRAIRVCNDKIFPQLLTGFGDLAPLVREQSVKSVLVIIPKLGDRAINGELLRQLAKTANDSEPGIRANTTICLGKIARNLGLGTRAKVLIAAFTRSLRDPFIHARNSALLALTATVDIFSEADCVNKLLPAIMPSLLDPEKLVRDSAFKTLDVFLGRVRKHASTLPDTALPPSNNPAVRPTIEQGPSWTGWAISSFTNKLATATGEIQPASSAKVTAIVASNPDQRPTSAPPPASNTKDLRPTLTNVRRITPFPSGLSSLTADEPSPTEGDLDAWDDAFFDSPNKPIDDDPSEEAHELPPAMRDSQRPPKADVPYDDSGEPDFSGWLAAQQSQKRSIGLPAAAKKSGGSVVKKTINGNDKEPNPIQKTVAPKAKVIKKPVEVPKPKPPAEEEDWSAWD